MDTCGHDYKDIRIVKSLGKGGFSEVFLGYVSKLFAIKEIPKRNKMATLENLIKLLQTEITINKMINCKFNNLLCFRGCVDSGDYVYLLFDYIPNVLELYEKYWKQKKHIKIQNLIRIMINMTKTIENIHSIGVLHLDIKPRNFLVKESEEEETEVYLIDYGYSCIMNETNTCPLKYWFGTPKYISPEMISGKSPENISTWSDIYSLGMIFYEFLSKDRINPYIPQIPPKDVSDLGPMFNNIIKLIPPHISINSYYSTDINDSIYNMVMLMIDKDIHKRPTIKQVISILTMRNKDE